MALSPRPPSYNINILSLVPSRSKFQKDSYVSINTQGREDRIQEGASHEVKLGNRRNPEQVRFMSELFFGTAENSLPGTCNQEAILYSMCKDYSCLEGPNWQVDIDRGGHSSRCACCGL
jgi:hypothetical protein